MVKSLYTVGGFPGGADGKESASIGGDPGLILGLVYLVDRYLYL